MPPRSLEANSGQKGRRTMSKEADRMFNEASDRFHEIRMNPVATPDFCKRAIPRAEADDGYAKWAEVFAILNPAVMKHARLEGRHELIQRGWRVNAGKDDCYYRDIGAGRLWVDKRSHGWIIELTHPWSKDPDARILTTFLGDMPILCHSFPAAVQLAEACYPDNDQGYPINWHSYR
jgi:hypothetical protein